MTEPLPMVRIRWNDAQDDAPDWCRIEDLVTTACIVTTIGTLLPTVRPNHVSVALSSYPDEEDLWIGQVLHIPQAMVVSMEHLGPAS